MLKRSKMTWCPCEFTKRVPLNRSTSHSVSRHSAHRHYTTYHFLLMPLSYDLRLNRSLHLRSSSSTRALNWVQSSSWSCWTPRARCSSAAWLRRNGLYCLSSPMVEGLWRHRRTSKKEVALLRNDVHSLTTGSCTNLHSFIREMQSWVTGDYYRIWHKTFLDKPRSVSFVTSFSVPCSFAAGRKACITKGHMT